MSVGPKEALATRRVPLKELNWLGDAPLDAPRDLEVKVRSTRPPREARLIPMADGTAEVELMVAEEGIAPGQACVFYDNDGSRVLGGGWITR